MPYKVLQALYKTCKIIYIFLMHTYGLLSQHPSPPDHSASWQDPHSPVTGINWNLLGATENTLLENSPLQECIQSVSQASLDFINNDLSDDELLERISIGSDSSYAPEGVYLFFSHLAIVQPQYALI